MNHDEIACGWAWVSLAEGVRTVASRCLPKGAFSRPKAGFITKAHSRTKTPIEFYKYPIIRDVLSLPKKEFSNWYEYTDHNVRIKLLQAEIWG